MTKILVFSAKKQGGKNTSVNHLVGLYMGALGIVRGQFYINQKGQLMVSDIDGDVEQMGIFDVFRRNETMKEFLAQRLNPWIKVYSYADLLKEEVCIKILGLTEEQCFGTDEQKNSLTNLKWEDMPGMSCPQYMLDNFLQAAVDGTYYEDIFKPEKSGFMTAREVMQYVGTNIFRKMYNNVWVDATIKKIQKDESELAVICDCRFPNEVEGAQAADGKVLRFLRAPFAETDKHESETALDDYPLDKFDIVIDNREMTIIQQCDAVYDALVKHEIIPDLHITQKDI